MEHSSLKGTLILSKGILIQNGTLILSKGIHQKGTKRNTHQNGRSLGSSFNDLLKTCLPLKLFLTTSPCLFFDSRITPAAQLGLVPYQNHIKPIYDPYMGHPHSKNWTLDFSPRFDFPLSPRSLFPPGPRFPLPNHVTSGFNHFRSRDFRLHEPTILFYPWSAVLSPPSP